jgi:hypothetical protein
VGLLKAWGRRRALRAHHRDARGEERWRGIVAALPVLRGMNRDELQRLRTLTVLFLHEKSMQGAASLRLTERMKWQIAVQACLPVLNLNLDYYAGWYSVIVYPAGFIAEHQRVDAAGVVHTERSPRSGESWEHGPVILSWADVVHSAAFPESNVVIHECAHKLDMLTGAPNGLPPLPQGLSLSEWSRVFNMAYADFRRRLAAGWDVPPLNPYAAESPAEFFAVMSEAFFGIPAVLHAVYPEVYQQLRAFYRQDPHSRSAAGGQADLSGLIHNVPVAMIR